MEVPINILNILHLKFYNKYIFLILMSFNFLCKNSDNTDFTILLKSTSPLEIQEFQENIIIELEYNHVLGFMGFHDPDYLSLEIKDSRLSEPDYYHLIPLSPPESTVSIKGIISIEIDSPFILGNGNIETLSFNIRIQDRNGEWSNTVSSPLITLNK